MAPEDMAALYDHDFYEWTVRTAEILRRGCVQEADLEHVAEEIEDMGKRDKRGVENRLVVLLIHLLKWGLQPGRRYSQSGSSSWLSTITEQRRRLRGMFKQSPSLESFACTALIDIYPAAVKEASAETGIPIAQFPSKCPFRFDQVVEDEFVPE